MRKQLLSLCAMALVASVAFAADEPKKMSAEEKAQMEAAMKAATPGDAHKKLDGMVGNWDAVVTSWNKPGDQPMKSTATSEAHWVLGGRWVEEKVTGNFFGMPFNGIGYTGYDNLKKQYVGTWMDNFSTSVMTSTGKQDDAKTWTFTSSMDDPMTGKTMPVEEKFVINDADHHTMEMWGPAPDGKMFKMMEITYTRKK